MSAEYTAIQVALGHSNSGIAHVGRVLRNLPPEDAAAIIAKAEADLRLTGRLNDYYHVAGTVLRAIRNHREETNR